MRACTRSRAGRGELFVGEENEARLQRVLALDDLGDCSALPAKRTVASDDEIAVGGGGDAFGAIGDLAGQRLLRGGAQSLRLRAVGVRVRREAETIEASDVLSFHQHIAGGRDLGFQHRVLFEPPHQHTGPPIDETGGQPLMQRIRQTILYRAGALLPMDRIAKPVRTVSGECPGSDVCDAVGEGVDVSVGAVGEGRSGPRTNRRKWLHPAPET